MRRAAWHLHKGVRSGDGLSAGEQAADVLKRGMGTWSALFGVAAAIGVWILLQKTAIKWDIYPFILLNLCLSCLAAVQGIVLQISANRGDRISSEVALHTQGNTDTLLGMNEQQLQILTTLNGLDGKVADLAQAIQVVMAARGAKEVSAAVAAKGPPGKSKGAL
jgi:uncharacterized membrane protein